MDETPHKGLLWEKVAEMQLPERELLASFDSEEDFVNYMNRAPKIAWDSVHGSSLDKIKAKAKDGEDEADEDEKPKAKSIADIKKKAKDLDEEDAD